MSVSLTEALQDVPLQVGQTYRCEVNGRLVELRVLADAAAEGEQMLDPWTEFPRPSTRFRLRVKPGELPPPDLPQIPTDSDG